MNVNLLYADRDQITSKAYFDWNSIIQDLGLEALFEMSMQGVVLKNGKVMYKEHEDLFIEQTMKKVMMYPLGSKDEVIYRHEIIQDCYQNKDLIDKIYTLCEKILADWDKLGRQKKNTGVRDTKAALITDMQVLSLLVDGMAQMKAFLLENAMKFTSTGFQALVERMDEEFSEEIQENVINILNSISFFSDISLHLKERNTFTSNWPKIAIDCGLVDGLKFGDMKLESIETKVKTFRNPYGLLSKMQKQVNHINMKYVALDKSVSLQEDAANLEYQVVSYVMNCCSGLQYSYGHFFDQLHFQIAFYRGAVNLINHMKLLHIDYCFPEVGEKNSLRYDGLKEVVMCFGKEEEVVGNSGNLDGKMLAIITGANQGGKSTFLRSVGIAQIMMQSGLMVGAKRFCSGLYTSIFTHFTRREDSAMNSGKLDEELRRMDQIINHIDENSLLILNESFASTTEKEGSTIAYDIVKALNEEKVKILTVTHLLSFAQKMYHEVSEKKDSDTAFLCAERLSNGVRTFRMILHEPELTSFGLELYDQFIKKQNNTGNSLMK